MTRWVDPTWRELIAKELAAQGEDWSAVVTCTLTPEELDVRFDNGFGNEHGQPFTAWTARRVYFPVCYDGSEWCGSVPREPCAEATKHVGGG
jgi:hypothetical protein